VNPDGFNPFFFYIFLIFFAQPKTRAEF
jgi:hypothetical protein